jgi:3-dehydroquinate dehydratase/shikimate dehydrogenase
MTLLVASIAASTPQQAATDLAAAIAAGADAIELRVDYLRDAEDVVIRSVAASRPAGVPLILTIRAANEGGAWDGDDAERISRLIALAPVADFLDVEFATWRRSANIRQKVGLALGDGESRRRLILSLHDLKNRPTRLLAALAEMYEQESADVIKVVWHARTVRDNFEAFDLLRAAAKPLVALCTGRFSGPSRILARKFSAFANYAAADEDRPAAPGQLGVAELKQRFRWDAIGPATRVFGVIGWPVEHSLSPDMHNAAFAAAGIDALYLPLPVEPSYESFKAFMVEALARPWLDLGGLSVTLPHKENALRFVREKGGSIDPAAGRIGAVNTIKFQADGTIDAINTDAPAALTACAALLGCPTEALRGLRAVILGAGGVARAVAAALLDAGATVMVTNRSAERAERLARDLGCTAGPWSRRADLPCELFVNCTSVGMSPAVDESPVPTDELRPGAAVLDVVYNPPKTRLLAEAAALGCRTASGLGMLVDQAARQFEFWTGRPAPREAMQRSAAGHLQTTDSA